MIYIEKKTNKCMIIASLPKCVPYNFVISLLELVLSKYVNAINIYPINKDIKVKAKLYN